MLPEKTFENRVGIITGGGTGIGFAIARELAKLGATVIIASRSEEHLGPAVEQLRSETGRKNAADFVVLDVRESDSVEAMVAKVHGEHGHIDFLVNNAGRSIRRAIEASYDRFHDYERTMQLNYFGCLRVTMGVLPGMVHKTRGHVVNISSIGVLTMSPRFAAIVASTAALDAGPRGAAPPRRARARDSGRPCSTDRPNHAALA